MVGALTSIANIDGTRIFCAGERHVDSPNKDVRNLATALFAHHEKFFVFVHHEGVEPTNNRAERALRAAVQWRKIMFGNRSDTGEFAIARLADSDAHVPVATAQCARLSGRRDSC
jgi:hypothetical protein